MCFYGIAVRDELFRLGSELRDLPKAAVFTIALLASFLTVVAVWQIPLPTTPTNSVPDTSKVPSLLLGNFARTVLSGLTGLAVTTLALDTIGQENKSVVQHYYLVWFILLFLLFLVALSLIKAGNEGWRAISYVGRPPQTGAEAAFARRWGWLRFKWWAITTIDVFFNLIQGVNNLKSTLWDSQLRNYQEDALIAIDTVARHLRVAIVDHLNNTDAPPPPPPIAAPPAAPVPPPPQTAAQNKGRKSTIDLTDVRVAVSVLSTDGKRVYYISWPYESTAKEFGTQSVAYVAVASGEIRWWERDYEQNDAIVLLDNSGGGLTQLGDAGKKQLLLKDFFQERGSDYSSFIVLPIPLRAAPGARRAGLHISFRLDDPEAGVRQIWPHATLNATDPAATYSQARNLLEDMPPGLHTLLLQSVNVVESLLRNFNEEVFEQSLRTRQRV